MCVSVVPRRPDHVAQLVGPHLSSKSITADGDVLSSAVSLGDYPVHVRKGACLPLQKSPADESVLFTWFAPELDTSASVQVREPWVTHPWAPA